MGIFSRNKKEKIISDWSDAYIASPKFYSKPDGTPFGAIALSENAKTVLPKTPQSSYAIDSKPVMDWRLVFVGASHGGIIGETDYFTALKKLEKYILDSNDSVLLVKALSSDEIKFLCD